MCVMCEETIDSRPDGTRDTFGVCGGCRPLLDEICRRVSLLWTQYFGGGGDAD